ncbi:TerB N-terminal domain-containing protein [uncultured Limosilactobacillus sp.]|uniref:TerB N-terminal domain-containing protein n=1 Tax=uncultured Limosilactobacillus sp. TaxID=2837629 RepID=UPI0025FB4A1E|nr:TerB N-terminal domain-containing protein [uncultured Limosilactobacillus sp.]
MNKTSLASFLLNKYCQRLSSVTKNGIDVTAALVRNDFTPWLMFYTNKQDDPHAMAEADGELAIKCGSLSMMLMKIPVFFKPSLTDEPGWVGVLMNDKNDRTIKDLIDSAWRSQERMTAPIKYVNLTDQDDQTDDYQPEFITGRPANMAEKTAVVLPLQLRKMKESYNYQVPLAHRQEVNFYRQGQMVSDYTDDYKDFAELYRGNPDYHGLTNGQLRTYFTLRTQWRQGKYPRFQHGMGGYLTLYMSELVNLIGCESPAQAFDLLRKFQRHYQAHFLPGRRPEEIPRDMVRYYGLDHQRAAKVFPDELTQDKKLHIVLNPSQYSAAELFGVFAGATTAYQTARLYKDDAHRFEELFKLVWQRILAKKEEHYDFVEQYLTVLPTSTGGVLFEGLIFDDRLQKDRVYQLDSLRAYRITGRLYRSNDLSPWLPNKSGLKKLFRELDRATRIAFQVGRPLKERKVDAEIKAAIKEGLRDYQQQQQQAKLDQVPIHLDHLAKIRDDAAVTQEQLLTDEEVDEQPVPEKTLSAPASATKEDEPLPEQPSGDGLPELTADEWFFLKALVNHQPYAERLKKHFLMASLVADEINEKLLDEIGDTVIEFDDHDQPQIVADYLTAVQDLLKKKEE